MTYLYLLGFLDSLIWFNLHHNIVVGVDCWSQWCILSIEMLIIKLIMYFHNFVKFIFFYFQALEEILTSIQETWEGFGFPAIRIP